MTFVKRILSNIHSAQYIHRSTSLSMIIFSLVHLWQTTNHIQFSGIKTKKKKQMNFIQFYFDIFHNSKNDIEKCLSNEKNHLQRVKIRMKLHTFFF